MDKIPAMKRFWLLSVVLALGWGVQAHATDWVMDKQTSKLQFVVRYEGSPTVGVFRQFDTRLDFDPRHPEEGHLHVAVSVASADMNSADINSAIREAAWFDVAQFPRGEFKSDRITRDKPNRYIARGTLRLKGVERPIAVPFTWQEKDGAATMTGRLEVKRTGFNIGTGEWADGSSIGLEVEVRFNVHLKRAPR
jgi:polyisoprenoid-binding protein YceI